MKKKTCFIAASLVALMILGQTVLSARTKFEQYIEIDLCRVEEAYRLIDTYGETVWPGWKNDMKIEFMLQYPNLVFVIVAPEGGNAPSSYELVPDRKIRGRNIYINRKDELPIKLQSPLVGGGKGGMRVRIMLQETKVTAGDVAKAIKANKKEKDPGFCPPCDSEGQILLICHEFFHGFQTKVMKPKDNDHRGDRDFSVTPEYSTYSEIEGQALKNALHREGQDQGFGLPQGLHNGQIDQARLHAGRGGRQRGRRDRFRGARPIIPIPSWPC